MRLACSFAVAAPLLLLAPSSHADDPAPDRGAALVAGAAVLVAGFTVGGMLVATGGDQNAQTNAGWLTMESAFAVAPLASHAVAGEWVRGLAWAGPPAAMAGGTAALFAYDHGTVLHGSLPEQRWVWTLFGLGLGAGAAGVLDVLWADRRSAPLAITPAIGLGHIGLNVQGML